MRVGTAPMLHLSGFIRYAEAVRKI